MNDTTPTPLSADQLAWLRHVAALGQAEPQALLHLLGRVEALEAAAAGPQPDKIDRLAEAFRAEDEAGAAPPDLTLAEAGDRWGLSSRNAIKARAAALGVELRRESSTRTVWPAEDVARGDRLADHLRACGTLANFPEAMPSLAAPHGHAYRYPTPLGGTTIRFTSGREINGFRPIEAIPYWLGKPPMDLRSAAALPEPAYLSDGEASALVHAERDEKLWDCTRRIHRAGWDAAMAAVKAQQQQPAAEATRLCSYSVGAAKPLEELGTGHTPVEPAPSPAKPQPHGGAMIINGRIVPIPTPAPAPSAPTKLVQQLACLIHAFASARRDRWPGNNATPTAIQAVRMVADWAENRDGFHVLPFHLRTEADRAAAELEGQSDG
jgi:hypothetical protein